MSPGWLLLGLLAVAFLGSNVARGRGVRGFGLPSGSEWIITGIALGPQLLGLVHFKELSFLSPVLAAGLGWVALTIGLRFGVCLRPGLDEEVRAPGMAFGLGAVLGAVTASALAAIVYLLLERFGAFAPRVRLGTACWIGCALSGSARQLVDWARERHGSRGAATDRIEAVIGGGEVVALAGTAPLSVLLFSEASHLDDMVWRAAMPLVLGLLLGLIALWLLRFEVRVAETWGILLGVQLLSAGLSLRAGSSVIAAGFLLGWLLGRDRAAGPELRRLTHPAEGAVLLPLLVVAGTSLQLSELGHLGWLVVAVVGARVVIKLILARITCGFVVGLPGAATTFGLSLASSGEIACLVALEYTLSTPGQLGQFVLACALATSLFGELYGAVGLRRTLTAANELHAGDTGNGLRRPHGSPDTTGWL
jgi:hypothetical protein